MKLAFSKYEGLGNDFLVVAEETWQASRLGNASAKIICDRHYGVGGDGVLVVGRTNNGQPTMRVINADGSTAEMCGNGIRCAALHIARAEGTNEATYQFRTDAGTRECHVVRRNDEAEVRAEMGKARFEPGALPMALSAPAVDQPLDVAGVTLHITAVSMGNPHAVTFDAVGERRFELGPALQKSGVFPDGVNVSFATLGSDGVIDLHVFERGSGWTRACGTGACATAVAAVCTHRANDGAAVDVRLPGGTLTVTVERGGERVRMRGPARYVFEGVIDTLTIVSRQS